jgi:hypothetical protein
MSNCNCGTTCSGNCSVPQADCCLSVKVESTKPLVEFCLDGKSHYEYSINASTALTFDTPSNVFENQMFLLYINNTIEPNTVTLSAGHLFLDDLAKTKLILPVIGAYKMVGTSISGIIYWKVSDLNTSYSLTN